MLPPEPDGERDAHVVRRPRGGIAPPSENNETEQITGKCLVDVSSLNELQRYGDFMNLRGMLGTDELQVHHKCSVKKKERHCSKCYRIQGSLKGPGREKMSQHSDMKLLPPTAKPWETSLPKWFDKRYTLYF